MQITSVIAIYVLFWVLAAFLLLPFGIRTHDEEGASKVPGQADSAPTNFRPGRLALRASILGALATALFTVNYIYGWISAEDINFFGEPPELEADG